MDWVTVFTQVGFPIGSALALAWFTKDRLDKSEATQAAREADLVGRIRELEVERVALWHKAHEINRRAMRYLRILKQRFPPEKS